MKSHHAKLIPPDSIPSHPAPPDLRGVGKVPELRLPDDEAVGVLHAVPELKAEDSVLAERRVGHGELAGLLAGVHMGQRHVLLPRHLVRHHRVPGTEEGQTTGGVILV